MDKRMNYFAAGAEKPGLYPGAPTGPYPGASYGQPGLTPSPLAPGSNPMAHRHLGVSQGYAPSTGLPGSASAGMYSLSTAPFGGPGSTAGAFHPASGQPLPYPHLQAHGLMPATIGSSIPMTTISSASPMMNGYGASQYAAPGFIHPSSQLGPSQISSSQLGAAHPYGGSLGSSAMGPASLGPSSLGSSSLGPSPLGQSQYGATQLTHPSAGAPGPGLSAMPLGVSSPLQSGIAAPIVSMASMQQRYASSQMAQMYPASGATPGHPGQPSPYGAPYGQAPNYY